MKKITFLLLLCSIVLVSYAQDASQIQHAQTFEMFHTVPKVGDAYAGKNVKAVRVGEFFWLAESLDSPHRTQGSGGGWSQVIEDESTIEYSVIEQYFTDNNLDKSMLSKFNGKFESLFGRHYNDYSIYGNWDAHSQYRRPMLWSTLFFNPNNHEERYPSGEMEENKYQWRTPRLEHVQQLFAMTGFSEYNTTGRLTGKDIRIDLAAKEGSNDLAYDIKLANSSTKFSDWHSTATGRYDFNLMPAGQTSEGAAQIKSLFKDVTFAINNNYDAMILRLGETIEYEKAGLMYAPEIPYPSSAPTISPFTWVYGADKWSTVRMCRALTPAELGYELYYNEAKKDIIKLANGVSAPFGYEILEHGYLRGFYTQYFIYETDKNPGYTVEDIIRFSKCVDDPLLPEPDCDCGAIYLTDHMKIDVSAGEEYSHNIFGSESFAIVAPNTNPQKVKIGLFNGMGTLVKRLDNGVGSDMMTYECRVESYNSTLSGTIQAYIEEYNPYGDNKIVTIGRLLGHEASSHLVDHLNVRYYRPGVTPASAPLETFTPELFSDLVQSGHMVGNFFPEQPNSLQSYVHSAEQGEGNWILVRLPLMAGEVIDDYTVALYNAEGDFTCEAAYSVKPSGSNTAMFTCYIPDNDHQGNDLEGGFDGVFVPVLKSSINQDNPTKVSKTSQVKSKVDRVPVYIQEDWGWGRSLVKQQPEEKLHLHISPNPVDDIFQVSGNFEKVLEINIYSVTGGLMKVVKNSNVVDIVTFSTGSYTVGVTTEKGYVAGTIIKK